MNASTEAKVDGRRRREMDAVSKPLYWSHQISEADPSLPILLVATRAAANALNEQGAIATTFTPWRDTYADFLRSRMTVLVTKPTSKSNDEVVIAGDTLLRAGSDVRQLTIDKLPTDPEGVQGLMSKATAAPKWERPLNAAELALSFGQEPPPVENEIDRMARLTDRAQAAEFVRLFGKGLHYNVAAGQFMVYARGRWVIDDTGEAVRMAKQLSRVTWALRAEAVPRADRRSIEKFCKFVESATGINAILKLARDEPGMPVRAAELDADPLTFNVLNGTIDLRSGRHREHSESDLLSKQAAVTFDASATAPRWERFLDRVMAGNAKMIGYLQRLAGMFLTADARVQELFVFWGDGANGKSVFLDTIAGLMADYASEAAPTLLTDSGGHSEHPTEIADLAGKRLVIASETEEGAKLKVQLVKRLTGNAIIKGRFMRQNFFEFPRTHKLVLVTNNRPMIRETTNAIWRRVRLIPFKVTIPENEQDLQLLDKLRAERPGILNWCIRGCVAWQRDGLQPPEEVMLETRQYQSEQDPLTEFIAEKCVLGPNAICTRTEILSTYNAWAHSSGVHQPLDRNAFYDRLRRLPDVRETMVRIKDQPTRVWKGVGIKTLATEYGAATQRLSDVA